MTYDDRLTGHDTIEDLLAAADEIATELAFEHYESCYDSDLCGACTEDTPISGEWGPWMGKKRKFDRLVSAVEERVAEIDPDDDGLWVQADLSGTYLDAFRAAGVDPEDCAVCTHQIVSEGEECGHERYGEVCPAR